MPKFYFEDPRDPKNNFEVGKRLVTQAPGNVQPPSADAPQQHSLAVRASRSAPKRSLKQVLRMAGAATVSITMVGVFALPVYASSPTAATYSATGETVFAQALSTHAIADISVPAQLPTAEEEPIAIVQVAATASGGWSSGWVRDIPASGVGLGLVSAAQSELGVQQDCTDLVQNALAALGFAERRDMGGYDYGVGSLRGVGAPVTNGEWAPGDVLGWPGYPHVAIYIGDGLAVHGGMGGNTVVASATGWFGSPGYVVRVG